MKQYKMLAINQEVPLQPYLRITEKQRSGTIVKLTPIHDLVVIEDVTIIVQEKHFIDQCADQNQAGLKKGVALFVVTKKTKTFSAKMTEIIQHLNLSDRRHAVIRTILAGPRAFQKIVWPKGWAATP